MRSIFLREFKNVVIGDKAFTLSFRNVTTKEHKKSMPYCERIDCIAFEEVNEEIVPYRRYEVAYNLKDKSYWIWKGNIVVEEYFTVAEEIEKLLNEKELQLVTQ